MPLHNLVICMSQTPIRDVILSHCSATDISLLERMKCLDLSNTERRRYLNPVRDLPKCNEILGRIHNGDKMILIGKDVNILMCRIQDPIQYVEHWAWTRTLHLWLAIVSKSYSKEQREPISEGATLFGTMDSEIYEDEGWPYHDDGWRYTYSCKESRTRLIEYHMSDYSFDTAVDRGYAFPGLQAYMSDNHSESKVLVDEGYMSGNCIHENPDIRQYMICTYYMRLHHPRMTSNICWAKTYTTVPMGHTVSINMVRDIGHHTLSSRPTTLMLRIPVK
jgi:hypothetical protein